MCRCAAVCLICLSLASLAFGQIPSGNVYIGYAHTDTNVVLGQSTGLNGWNGSLEAKVLPFIGLVADFSGFYGSQSVPVVCPGLLPPCSTQSVSADLSEYNFLFGPRASFRIRKFRPFVHALIGAGHIRESGSNISSSATSVADALGGGLDYHLIPLVSWRIQIDALQTRFYSTSQNNVRFSTGIAVHF